MAACRGNPRPVARDRGRRSPRLGRIRLPVTDAPRCAGPGSSRANGRRCRRSARRSRGRAGGAIRSVRSRRAVRASRVVAVPAGGPGQLWGATRLLRAADGWIAVTLARPDDRRSLPAWLGVDPESAFVVTNADPWVEVARRVGERRSAELVELATLLGLACAGVGETAPTPACSSTASAMPRRGPLAGLRVANLASLWAGPLAADVLARLGADVVCVESTGRPDGARATRTWFDAMHAGQRSVAVDFRSDTGVAQLKSLLDAADVVIEGSRPRALEQLGISAADIGVEWSAGVAVDHRLRPRSLAGDAGRLRRRRGGGRGTGGCRRGWAGVHRRCDRRSDHRSGGGEHDRRPDRRRRSLDRRRRPGPRRRGRRPASLRPDRRSPHAARRRPAGSLQRPRSSWAPTPMPSSTNGRDGDHTDSIRRVRRSASYIGVTATTRKQT